MGAFHVPRSMGLDQLRMLLPSFWASSSVHLRTWARCLACSQNYWTATVLLVRNHSRLNVSKAKLPIGRPQTWVWTSITWEPIKMQIPIQQDREGLMQLSWGPHFPSQLNKHGLEAFQAPGTVPSPRNTKIRQGPCLWEVGVVRETA